LSLCLLILLNVLAYELIELNRKTPLPPLPNPNGYATDSLDALTCRDLTKRLQEMERRQESLAEIMRNEEVWVRLTIPVWQRFAATLPFASLTKRAQKNFVTECNQSELPFKRLVVDLAVRAYELDHGQHPKSLNQLVPDYLNAVSVDPVTGMKLTN